MNQIRRLDVFENLKNHAWYGKVYLKLSEKDLEFCRDFLKKFGESEKDDYAKKVQMTFLSKANEGKSWNVIEELLMICR